MKDLPNPFWALMFMLLGCGLLVVVLLKPSVTVGIAMAVATAGSNLISGAFGYINGHKDGVASVSVPSSPSSTNATTVSIGDVPPVVAAVEPPKEAV